MKEKRFFCVVNVSEPSNPPDELAQHVSKKKKNLSDEIFLYFFEGSESYRVFNYLHDSNSIFRAGKINSEKVPGCTVQSGLMNGKGPVGFSRRCLHRVCFAERDADHLDGAKLMATFLTVSVSRKICRFGCVMRLPPMWRPCASCAGPVASSVR